MTCQCGNPENKGIHWEEKDGNCCLEGCTCVDCVYWVWYESNIEEMKKLEKKAEYAYREAPPRSNIFIEIIRWILDLIK